MPDLRNQPSLKKPRQQERGRIGGRWRRRRRRRRVSCRPPSGAANSEIPRQALGIRPGSCGCSSSWCLGVLLLEYAITKLTYDILSLLSFISYVLIWKSKKPPSLLLNLFIRSAVTHLSVFCIYLSIRAWWIPWISMY